MDTKYITFINTWLLDLFTDEKSNRHAQCILSISTFDPSDMGKGAIDTHARSKKKVSKNLNSWLIEWDQC